MLQLQILPDRTFFFMKTKKYGLHSPLRISVSGLVSKEEYEALDRSPTFTPLTRYADYTVTEIRDRLFGDLPTYRRPTLEQVEAIAKLLLEK